MKNIIICSLCKKEKEHKAKGYCLKCYRHIHGKEYYQNPIKRKKILEQVKRRNQNPIVKQRRKLLGKIWRNKPEVKEHLKKYREINKDKTAKRMKRYMKENIKQRINRNIGCNICHSLKEGKNYIKWEYILGYTKEDLMEHLEEQFSDGICWDNYGWYWHIDHKKPASWFIFNSYNDGEFKKCWKLDNLQPLKAIDNFRKGNRFSDKAECNIKESEEMYIKKLGGKNGIQY